MKKFAFIFLLSAGMMFLAGAAYSRPDVSGEETGLQGTVRHLLMRRGVSMAEADKALGEMLEEKEEALVDALIAILLGDENEPLWRRAASWLGKTGNACAEEPLIWVLKNHEKEAARRSASSALLELGRKNRWVLTDGMEDDSPEVRLVALELIAGGGGSKERIAERLLEATKDEDARVRERAGWLLSRGVPMTGAAWVPMLNDESAGVRRMAASVLGRKRHAPALRPLILALRDEDAGVRAAAAESIGEIGGRRPVRTQSPALVRAAAAGRLGRLGGWRAVRALSAALDDEDEGVRSAAAGALGKIGNRRAVSALAAALDDENMGVRNSAVIALGEIGDPSVLDDLIKIFREDERLRRSAAGAIGSIGGSKAIEVLIAALDDDNPDVRKYAVEGLGRLEGPRIVENLAKVLNDESYEVRLRATEALGKTMDIRAVEHLISAEEDESEQVRSRASWALRRIRAAKDYEARVSLSREAFPVFEIKNPVEYFEELETRPRGEFWEEIYDKTRVLFYGDIVYWFRTGEPESRHPRWFEGKHVNPEDVKMDFVSFPGSGAVILESPNVVVAGTGVYRIAYSVQSESLAREAVLGNITFPEFENELLTGIEDDHGIRGRFSPPMYAAWQMRAYGEILRNYETSRRGLQSSLKRFARENGRFLTNEELRSMPLDFTNPLLEVPGARLDFFLDPFGERLEVEGARVLEPDSVAAVREARKNAFFVNARYRLRAFPFLYAPFWFLFQFAAFFLHRTLGMMVILYRERTYRRTVVYWLSAIIIPVATIKMLHPGHIYAYAFYALSRIFMLLVIIFLLIMPMHLKRRVDRTGKKGAYTGKSFLRDVGIFLFVSIIFFVFVLLR